MSNCNCSNDVPSFADDPRLIFSTYAVAFIPLAVIYALDFITDKWRTIRDTRRNGMMQLFISLPSLGCIIFYIVVQMQHKDYKEAAAAIAVAGFNSIHVLRTIWGLILLYEFKNWNIYALRCLHNLGYGVPKYRYSYDVQVLLRKMKTNRAKWKRPLVRLIDNLKTSFFFVSNWSLSGTQPVSPSSASVQLNSSSSALRDRTVDEIQPRVSHDMVSYSAPPGSDTDRGLSHRLTEQQSFSSTFPDSAIVENRTYLFRLFGVLKTSMRSLFWAIRNTRVFCKGMKKNIELHYNWAMGNMESEGAEHDLSLEEIERTVDYHMVVNCTLIDNEFSNTELPVRPTLFSRVGRNDQERHTAMARFVASCLKSIKPEECSVRWLVSFLARFGHRWLVDTKGLRFHLTQSQTSFKQIKVETSQKLGVLVSAHTTQGSVEGNGSTQRFVTLLSPYHKYSKGDVDYLQAHIGITPRCMLPFKMNGDIGTPLRFWMQEATIRDAAKDDWHKSSLNELDEEERSAVENITDIQLAYFSALMESVELAKGDGSVLEDNNSPMRLEREDPSMDNLMYQLGYDAGEDYSKFFKSIPVRKELLSPSLWDNNSKCLLLQTSIHVDNFLALEFGNTLDAYVEECEATSQVGELEPTTMVFENQYNLEMRRLQSELVPKAESTIYDTPRFIGCVAETVRSILASWVTENHAEAAGWNTSIAPVGIRFVCSKQLCSEVSKIRKVHGYEGEMQSLYMRLIWEVQAHLQWKVGDEVAREGGDIRQSLFLIMLFILGFPSLKVETTENEEAFSRSSHGDHTVEFEDGITVNPVAGPQELHILLTCDQESETVSVIFSPQSHVFKWQEWKDAFMGRLSAQKDWRLTQRSSHQELLRTEANHSDICSPVEHIVPEKLDKEYGLRYWSGWPPFMPRIAQFEIRNMADGKCGSSYYQDSAQEYAELLSTLNGSMDIVQQSTVMGTLNAEGHHAMEEGEADDALKQSSNELSKN